MNYLHLMNMLCRFIIPIKFAGSGHILGAASSTQTSSGIASWIGGAASGTACSGGNNSTIDKETIAARRLAAISAQAQNNAVGSQESGHDQV